MEVEYFGLAPVRPGQGHLVGFSVPLPELVALLLSEDGQELPAGGAVRPQPGNLKAPPAGRRPHVRKAGELRSLEEALPGVGHPTFHTRLVAGVAYPCGICDEAPVLGVLQEAACEAGMERIGSRHPRREVIHDKVVGHTLEEGLGSLQPLRSLRRASG